MAFVAAKATVNQALPEGHYNIDTQSVGGSGAVSTTAVATDVATLVADGASPTQAHVTTLNTDWGTLLAAINASNAVSGNVSIQYDASVVTTKNQLREAVRALMVFLEGNGALT